MYADGIGEDAHGERLLMESSSGAVKENFPHTMGDTVKLIQSAAEVLKAEAMTVQDARLETFLKRKVLMVHLVTQKMTLSSVCALQNKKYKVGGTAFSHRSKQVGRTAGMAEDVRAAGYHHGKQFIKANTMYTLLNCLILNEYVILGCVG